MLTFALVKMRAADASGESVAIPGWYVYLVRCRDGSLYCGCTNDLSRRLGAHGAGRVKYTRGRLPVKLVWSEPVPDRSRALKRELEVKRLSRRDKLGLVRHRPSLSPLGGIPDA